MWFSLPLAAEIPLAVITSYWLLTSALIATLELLWLRAQRESAAAANPFLAQLRDMLTYGKVKENCSPRQNVPKAWFGHFYVVRTRVCPCALRCSGQCLLTSVHRRYVHSLDPHGTCCAPGCCWMDSGARMAGIMCTASNTPRCCRT